MIVNRVGFLSHSLNNTSNISKNVTATEFSKFQQHLPSTQRLVSTNTCTCSHRISSTKRD
jgi:hypothetical protein